jgi:hypothetical protein
MTPTEQLDKLIPTLRRMLPEIRLMGSQVHTTYPVDQIPESALMMITIPVPYPHFMIMAASTAAFLAEWDERKKGGQDADN